WSNNLLSVLSLVSMLIMVMALGYTIFRSRTVGRLGAALFFFHGSLAYISFLRSQGSINNAIRAVTSLNSFLPTGFPYRGEDWGIWSLVTFLNQRHFASAIGILLLVLAFLGERYRAALHLEEESDSSESLVSPVSVLPEEQQWLKQLLKTTASYIFF